MRISALKKAKKIAEIARAKKGENIVILDLRKITNIWDFFVIISSTSIPHTQALIEEITKQAKKEKILIHHKEADTNKSWVIIDFFDVLCHIFTEEKRNFYNLEYVWSKAKK